MATLTERATSSRRALHRAARRVDSSPAPRSATFWACYFAWVAAAVFAVVFLLGRRGEPFSVLDGAVLIVASAGVCARVVVESRRAAAHQTVTSWAAIAAALLSLSLATLGTLTILGHLTS